MSERRQRRWSWWAGKGAVAMAILAALSLAVTVALASRALDHAADVVVLGDGQTLISGVLVDLWRAESLTSERLATVIAKHDIQVLDYLALVDRQDHHVIIEAGAAVITKPFERPGEIVRQGRRVRLVALIPPRAETRAVGNPAALFAGPELLQPFPRPFLVVEFEPPLIQSLQNDLTRIGVVAAVAALVLVAFAFAWSRTTTRLLAIQQQVEGERRLVALGRASSVIAHELRNPLAALKGHAQLLVEDLAGPSQGRCGSMTPQRRACKARPGPGTCASSATCSNAR